MTKDQPSRTTRSADPAQQDDDALLPGEMRRKKPPKEAVEAAFQRFQSIAAEVDATEQLAEAQNDEGQTCPSCRQRNRLGNKFCSLCGSTLPTPVDQNQPETKVAQKPSEARADLPATGVQHHHHHYHYHYFPGTTEAPRNFGPAGREPERPAILTGSATKGEHYSRTETAVRRLTQDWVIACNTKHLEDVLELYSHDAIVFRSNQPAVRSSVALREYFVAALEAGLGEVAMEATRVEISGEMAYEAGKFSALLPGSTGKRREERGKYVRVLAKDAAGDWKISVDCWSSDLTLADEPARLAAGPARR